ncbi:MAG: tetratricopeptide repeat protein, partial [Bacteroidales bacterium]|nr:tetratricopeptide repeat protein [Bacteroidales bacterium]
MKKNKIFLLLSGLFLSYSFSFGQDISKDTIQATEYMVKADHFNLIRKRDSSVFYYDKASSLFLNNYIKYRNPLLLNRYIHCQSNYAYDLAILGKVDNACKIVDTLFTLTEKYQVPQKLLAKVYLAKGFCYDQRENFPEAIDLYAKSLELFESTGDTNNIYVCRLYSNVAIVFNAYGMYDEAIAFAELALQKVIQLFGEETTNSAALYNIAGIVYESLSEYERAMHYKRKALQIFKKVEGEQSMDVADVLLNLGGLHQKMLHYDKALEYYKNALTIYLELVGKDDLNIANVYNNLAVVYESQEQYNLALEYYLYAKDLYLEILGENHTKVALVYNNLGVVYELKGDYSLANEYYQKALTIRKKILGNNHPDVALTLTNLAVLQMMLHNYDSAIEYLNNSLSVKQKIYGDSAIAITPELFNLGKTYKAKGKIDSAYMYYEKTLEIRKKFYGSKHPGIAWIYSNLGVISYEKGDVEQSLSDFQHAIIALVPQFNLKDPSEIPALKYVENKKELLVFLMNKIQVFFDSNDSEYYDDLSKHIQVCDTIINQMRQTMHTKSDKLDWGERSVNLYLLATDFYSILADEASNPSDKYNYLNEAFLFAEKCKAAVLLEALASSEAKRFAHIPDTLLLIENNLKSEIAFYQKELLTNQDSLNRLEWRKRLFDRKRNLDSLAKFFETNFQDYFELQYSSGLVSLKDFQKLLDDHTVVLSYLTFDNLVLFFNISKDSINIEAAQFSNLLEYITRDYRNRLSFVSGSHAAASYKKQAREFYQKLIPQHLDPHIENLIIIPDAELSMIPFETFLTEEPGDQDWNELAYLIKKYNISYSYSANLFYKTLGKEPSGEIETTELNDWIAFAPVFDDSNTAGLTLRTRELLREFDSEIIDSVGTRGSLINGGYISSLPGTESEVKSIFSEFDEKGKKAVV